MYLSGQGSEVRGQGSVALGHRRLAIIDLSGGQQPMANEDGSVWVVFNGEIYNFRDLRRRLEGAGHQFRTQSDTEVLVHLYEDEGPEMLPHLNGMFAFALWDARRGQLLLARDRLGKKPLVYRHEPGRLLFASELKSILQVPGVPREIDPQALDDYLTYQYVPHPRTIFRGIAKLPPGHYALYREGRLEVRPYWQPDFNVEEDRPAGGIRPAVAGVAHLGGRDAFAERRAAGGVPVRRDRLDDHRGADVATGPRAGADVFHRVPGQGVRRDRATPGVAAERFGTLHEEFQVRPDAMEVLPRLVWHYDEPFADSSAVPTWYVSQLTRQRVTVALTGDGGDELFAGYPRYLAVWLAEGFDRLPKMLRRAVSRRLLAEVARRHTAEVAFAGVSSGSSRCSGCRRAGGTWSGLPFSGRPAAGRSIATDCSRRCPRPIRWSSSPPRSAGPTAATP